MTLPESIQPFLDFLLEEWVAVGVAFGTLGFAAVAAYFSFRSFRLKSGVEIRGTWSLASSIYSAERYVSSITLENMKDRAVIVFKVFLEVGHGYLIEVEDFEDDPLVLSPFGVFAGSYDPIDMYSVSMKRIEMDDLLRDEKVRKRLVLATPSRRYNVKHGLDRWDPVLDFFRNHLTAVVRPLRSTYKGKAYGAGTKYIVRVEVDGGREEVIPIHPNDHRVRRFRGFRLTEDSLASKEALEEFLLERATSGELKCVDLEVLDLEDWRQQVYGRDIKETVEAVRRGWFVYRVLGRVITIFENWRMKRRNRRRASKNKEKAMPE